MSTDRELYEQFRVVLEHKLQDWAASAPDQPVIAVAAGQAEGAAMLQASSQPSKNALSPLALVEQVRQRTEIGERFTKRWFHLATARALADLMSAPTDRTGENER